MNYLHLVILMTGCAVSTHTLQAMDTDKKQDILSVKKKHTFIQDISNGAFAGGTEVMLNNPLVVITNNLMLMIQGNNSNKKPFLNSLKSNVANPQHMIKKYYKGCGTGVALMAPITALQNSAALILTKAFGDNPTLTQKTMAACGAGYLAALLASPADLVVLQRQNPEYCQESLKGTLQRIYKVNSLATFYRGLNGTGIRDGIFTAAYKTGGNTLQNIVPTITGDTYKDKLLCASLAGVIAATLSHPANVVTARMKSDLSATYYKTTPQTIATIVKKEGFSALFKGLSPRAIRIMLAIPWISMILDYDVSTKISQKMSS